MAVLVAGGCISPTNPPTNTPSSTEPASPTPTAIPSEALATPSVPNGALSWTLLPDLFGNRAVQTAATMFDGAYVVIGAQISMSPTVECGGAVWTSNNGVDWRLQDGLPLTDSVVVGVAAFKHDLLATGLTPGCAGSGGRRPVLWRGPSLSDWMLVDQPSGLEGAGSLAATGDFLVVVGSQAATASPPGAAWYSADGETWTRAEMPPNHWLSGVVAHDGALVVSAERDASDGSAIFYTGDGLKWEVVYAVDNSLDSTISGLASGPAGFLGVESKGSTRAISVLSSPDGRSWHSEPAILPLMSSPSLAWVGTWLLIGDTAGPVGWEGPVRAFTSLDGHIWDEVDLPAQLLTDEGGVGAIPIDGAALIVPNSGDPFRQAPWLVRPSE